tara:strand:+ start:44721 stop:44879 length:159 start_codon:yes stop_codon:yes gene_type:complete
MITLKLKAIYCGDCYHGDETYPFGFCKECWIKAGSPKGMNGESEPIIRKWDE